MSEPAIVREVIPLSRFADGIDIRILPPGALPPDIAHCLDAEVEMGGLTTDQRAFVDLFDGEDLEWFRELVHDGGPQFPLVIRDRFEAWRETAAPEDAMALDWVGLLGLRAQFDEVALRIADRAAGDGVRASDATRIERFVAASEEAATFAGNVLPLAVRTAGDVARWGMPAFVAARHRCAVLYAARGDDIERRDAEVRDWGRALEGLAPTPAAHRTKVPLADLRRRAALARRVLAKSHALLRSIAGADKAKAWLSGEEVTVEGRRFDFPVRVARVHHAGAGAVDVRVTDKSGVELARLCVFNPDTPALDQVSALVLHVISGEEDAIVATANIIRLSEAADRNEAFRTIRGEDLQMGPGIIDLGVPVRLAAAILPSVRSVLGAMTEREAWGGLAGIPAVPRPWDDGSASVRAA